MDTSLVPLLRTHARHIVRRAARPGGPIDKGTFTMSVARGEIEKALGLDEGELGKGDWRGLVKGVVQEALDSVDDGDDSHAESSSSRSPSKRTLKKAVTASSSAAQTGAKRKKEKKASRSPSAISDATVIEEEEDAGHLSDMSSVYDEPPRKRGSAPKKGAKAMGPKSKGKKGKMSKSTAGSLDEEEEVEGDEVRRKAIQADGGSESDMSSVYDVPPARAKPKGQNGKRASKSKSASALSDSDAGASRKKTGAKRKRKDPNEGLSADEAKVADLKRIVVACGVRKQWAKEFADCPTIHSQISHLQRLLSSLGMKGTPSIGKAKALKEKRDLAAELDDVRSFEQARGVSSGGRRASRQSAKRAETISDVDSGAEDETAPGKESALGAVLDFLGADSDED